MTNSPRKKDVLYPNLVAEMARHGYTTTALARETLTTVNTMSSKLNGTSEWKLSEMRYIAALFGQSMDYLFAEEYTEKR